MLSQKSFQQKDINTPKLKVIQPKTNNENKVRHV